MTKFLFVLSKDDNEAATRCFQMAKIAHSRGYVTNMFFLDDGVMWADSTRDLTIRTKTGDCPNDYLPYLIENEVITGVCTPCANARNVDETNFFTNMSLDGGPHLIEMAAEAKVFNF